MSAVIEFIETMESLKVSPVPSLGAEPTPMFILAIFYFFYFYILVWSTVIEVLSTLKLVLSHDNSNISSVQQSGAENTGIASVVFAVSPQ
ncbi:MAG TPA: hypothetical protein DHV22_04380 [Xanthomarina gelatinilytica]|uniref:Uncharacterized protein n=1 Tax=Xanthomarina gelatinilytica TaxID=1137281 RepID=A0A3D6BNR9_9FLAO|nr:hypothetical protein [Xanthomarina gelatinilytica]